MKLIYIGEHFYDESRTHMSWIYDTDGNRQDWGKVQLALRNGETVSIRPATSQELVRYEIKLRALKQRFAARDAP